MNTIFKKIITEENDLLEIFNKSLVVPTSCLITYFNQHCFNIYYTDTTYRDLIDNYFKVYPDGAGIHLVLNYIFQKKHKSFNATDINEKILDFIIRNEVKFYIIGGNFNKEILLQKFNNSTSFLGYWSGYFSKEEYIELVNDIKNKNPDIILIGMGVPKQEIIAYKLSKICGASVFLCVGNFLEFYLGTVKRIPLKFRDKGLEWIYRIYQEPKRLWKRYIIGIPIFIFRVIKFKLSINKNDSAV